MEGQQKTLILSHHIVRNEGEEILELLGAPWERGMKAGGPTPSSLLPQLLDVKTPQIRPQQNYFLLLLHSSLCKYNLGTVNVRAFIDSHTNPRPLLSIDIKSCHIIIISVSLSSFVQSVIRLSSNQCC
jgi:hypothetical protein